MKSNYYNIKESIIDVLKADFAAAWMCAGGEFTLYMLYKEIPTFKVLGSHAAWAGGAQSLDKG